MTNLLQKRPSHIYRVVKPTNISKNNDKLFEHYMNFNGEEQMKRTICLILIGLMFLTACTKNNLNQITNAVELYVNEEIETAGNHIDWEELGFGSVLVICMCTCLYLAGGCGGVETDRELQQPVEYHHHVDYNFPFHFPNNPQLAQELNEYVIAHHVMPFAGFMPMGGG
jgi:hypothetical protein